MTLQLDHIPFLSANRPALVDSFRGLGFLVSPNAHYTSAEFPGEVWETNCVFLRQGWFDLLHVVDQDGLPTPTGCLYRTDSLDTALRHFDDSDLTARYSLDRYWDDLNDDTAHFELAALGRSPCDLPLAIIAHPWPSTDILKAWLAHPNGAVRLAGVCRKVTDASSEDVFAAVLDSSQARTLNPTLFEERFVTEDTKTAITVQVDALSKLMPVLEQSNTQWLQKKERIIAYPAMLNCVFEFVSTS